MYHELFYINIFTKIDMWNPGRIISIEHGNNIHCRNRIYLSDPIVKCLTLSHNISQSNPGTWFFFINGSNRIVLVKLYLILKQILLLYVNVFVVNAFL